MVYSTIKIKTELKEEIQDKCVEEFLRHNPKMKEMKISFNKILYEMKEFYLRR